MSRKTWKARLWLLSGGALLGGAALVLSHDVSGAVTEEDASYIAKYLAEVELPGGSPATWDFAKQVAVIRSVQEAVLAHNPVGRGIPEGQPREPKDLYVFEQGGLCYDRSNVLEKIFRSLGFEARHASLYFSDASAPVALATPGVPSHAVSEVRTRNGWLLVDSNAAWLALDNEGRPLSARVMAAAPERLATPAPGSFHMEVPMRVVYGLKSRHGRFYPPFNPIPDYSLVELVANLE